MSDERSSRDGVRAFQEEGGGLRVTADHYASVDVAAHVVLKATGEKVEIARVLNTTTDALHSRRDLYRAPKLPGVVIFVHGVNSDGEWYAATEHGLAKGLNARLRRDAEHVAHPEHVPRMQAARYRAELTERGFIEPRLSAENFVDADEHSPVIRFRWGYRASLSEKAELAENLFLNERDAWGGGPFANGCTHPADCFTEGVSDRLFAFLRAQDFNDTPGREVYRLPHRAYYAHAAYRLARLVALVREKRPDTPVTIVSHSQGTIIAMLAAFVGEGDLAGAGVADCYHLFNSPFNLSLDGFARFSDESIQRANGGRVTQAARFATFARFLAIVAKRKGKAQWDEDIDALNGNADPKNGPPGYTAAGERDAGRDHHGRVFTHCNPADQVISVATVQGIGWRGVSEIEWGLIPGADEVLRQRVWADGVASPQQPNERWTVGVGKPRLYDYWKNHWRAAARQSGKEFWYPPPPFAKFRFRAALADPGRDPASALPAAVAGVVIAPIVNPLKVPLCASPPRDHVVPDNGPEVPEKIVPQAVAGGRFDQGLDPEHELLATRDPFADPDDPYNQVRRDGTRERLDRKVAADAKASGRETRRGAEHTEAALRYEHNARVRMEARRQAKGWERERPGESEAEAEERTRAAERQREMVNNYDGKDEDAMTYMRRFDARRKAFLAESIRSNATDHSSILTHALHAEKVLAYDVAVGYCLLSKEDWRALRQVADWRWIPNRRALAGSSAKYREYFATGEMNGKPLQYYDESSPEKLKKLGISCHREPPVSNRSDWWNES